MEKRVSFAKALPEDSRPPRLFSRLTPEQSELVLQSAERQRFSANRTIVTAGSPATSLFQLTEGAAKYFRVTKNGDEVLLWWLSKGDTFGLAALLGQPLHYIGTAQAMDDCELLVWCHEKIRSLARDYEVLAENALYIVLYYLAAYADRLVGLT